LHCTASEAPAALGQSKYTTRSELLRQKATGAEKEVDAFTQDLFDQGHAAEERARFLAEEIIVSDLYPITATLTMDGIDLLASLDGSTMDEEVIWEHKLWSEPLAAAVRQGVLEPHYTIQMDQELLVSGAKKCLFMTSDGTRENMAWCWYESSQEKFDALISGWRQFQADLAAYVPHDIPDKPKAEAIMALPALAVQIRGEVITSNLPAFKSAAEKFIAGIKMDLATDEDFANGDATVKFCDAKEKEITIAMDAAIAQMASIDELMRTGNYVKDQLRTKRLALSKQIETRKTQIKETAVAERRQRYGEHVAGLNKELAVVAIDVPVPDFAGAIKGLKTIASLYDKLDTALANGKIAADAAAKDLRAKVEWYRQHGAYEFLFRDLQTLIQKPKEDFELAVTTRIEAHKQAEEKRKADEAEKAKAAAAVQPTPIAEPTKQVIAPRVAPAVSAPKGAPTLRLGQINERLAPIGLTAEGLATLGFKHSATDKAAKLYFESEFEPICAALVRHLEAALQKQAA
jgi:predicted phage-related endonuclease